MRHIELLQEVGLPATYNEEAIKECVRTIASKLEKATAVSDLGILWNEELALLLNMEREHPEHKKYVERFQQKHFFIVPKLFFALLGLFIQEDEEVKIKMPSESPQSIFMVGWQLSKGTLIVDGDVGSIGNEATGSAKIILNGNTEDAGLGIQGNAYLEIHGNATGYVAQNAHGKSEVRVYGNIQKDLGLNAYGMVDCKVYGNVSGSVAVNAKDNASFYIKGDVVTDMTGGTPGVGTNTKDNVKIHVSGNVKGGVGIEATDDVSIKIDGDAGDYVGYGTTKNVHITVQGSAGKGVGEKAQGKVSIEIYGNAGKNIGKRAYRNASIIVHGEAQAGEPNKSFAGILSINGQRLY